MKITLISLDQLIISYGVRLLSSCLKEKGFDVEMVFARAVIGQPLNRKIENQIVKLCNKSNLVGISLMSNHLPHAISLTKQIKKKFDIPIIWGGVHPTFCPEESLEFTDLVCVGEGEKGIVELALKLKQKKGIENIKGIWLKTSDKIVKNGSQPLVNDLDSLPFPDFGPDDHFIRDGEKIKIMTKNLFQNYLTKREIANKKFVAEYYISSSRGCPFRCSYCASNTIKNLYEKQRFFRLRSPEKVVEEVKILISKYDFVRWIYFSDDDLLASPTERVKAFCNLWKKEIRLPFYATVAPWSYDEKKLEMFIAAGLGVINMGIQTVSGRGGKAYHRIVSKSKLRQIIKSIYKTKPPLPPIFDFILDNPYETDKDKLENLDFILSIPRPKRLQLFSLVPFPGTEIYSKMKKEGLLKNEEKIIYNKSYSYPEPTYINMLTFLASTTFPTHVVKLMRGKTSLAILNSLVAKWILRHIPYATFLLIARNIFNARFWKFNTVPKGSV